MPEIMNNNSRYDYFILRCQKIGKQKFTLPQLSQSIDVLGGELLKGIANKDVFILHNLNLEIPVELECRKQEVKLLLEEEFHLLNPIAACSERLKVYETKGWLKEGRNLSIGDLVTVYIQKHKINGKLQFKGYIKDHCGIMFGVELNTPSGYSNGEYQGSRYFETNVPDTAVFVPLNKIRKYSLPLQIGDRVVWVSDDGPEYGTVRWIGNLETSPNITVGVEFDNPCGTGTGRYNREQLFKTEPRHASLIPIEGLLKESVYLDKSEARKTAINDLQQPLCYTAATSKRKNSYRSQLNDPKKPQSKKVPEENEYLAGRTEFEKKDKMSNLPSQLPQQQHQPLIGSSDSTSSLQTSASQDHREIDSTLEIGSMVEIPFKNQFMYGVIRWMGEDEQFGKIVGLEMEEEAGHCNDGYFKEIRRFDCPSRKGFFIGLHKCKRDRRFDEKEKMRESMRFGEVNTPDISEIVQPPQDFDHERICGKNKGIQGHHNSCYLDVMLFSMFYFTTVLDSIFFREKTKGDIEEYEEVQKTLAGGIVYPLRKLNYVRADKVMKLRSLLDKVGNMPGMMNEEKDPEELLNCLFGQVMKADPLLQLSSSQQAYSYQLFMERDEKLELPTIQQLFELSFLQSNIKLSKMPSCLILQMPRFGKDYKMYNRILPSLQLDITDVLEKGPRECVICGDLATRECKQCYKIHGEGLYTIAFCETCEKLNHSQKRKEHTRTKLEKHKTFSEHMEHTKKMSIPREKMELFAIICIETSHYVSFVKCNSQDEPRWVFYDSMADREGTNDGYNIPEVRLCPDLQKWVQQSETDIRDKDLPELQRRLFSDSYMCLYQDPRMMRFQ